MSYPHATTSDLCALALGVVEDEVANTHVILIRRLAVNHFWSLDDVGGREIRMAFDRGCAIQSVKKVKLG